jgi:hypothetical protein
MINPDLAQGLSSTISRIYNNRALPMKIIQRFHPAIFLLVLILFFLGKKLIPVTGSFIGSFDTQLHFWNFHFIHDQMSKGELPFWNPYYYCGQPFLANPVIALFYPSTILFLILPFPWAFNMDILCHLFIAATGAYLLVYNLTGLKRAGIASATLYCLNGYFLIRIFTGHLNLYHAAALIPWIFLYTEKYIQTDRKVFIISAGFLVGLQILSGDAQTCYYTGLALAVYYFFRNIHQDCFQSLKKLWKPGLFFAFIPLTAIGIGSIQMIPSMEFISNCQRADNSYEFSTYQSFPPENFFTFLVPHPKDSILTIDGEFTGYTGILSIFMALIGAFFSKHREYKICFGIVLMISITIVLGKYTPIYKIFYNFAPLFSSFRIPSRCLVMVVLCITVFAGLGVQHIIESSLTKNQNNICIAVGCFLLMLIFAGSKEFQIKLLSFEIITALLLTVCSIGILFWLRKSKRLNLISIAILILLFADLYVIYAQQIPTLEQNDLLEEQPYEKKIKTDPGYHRVMMPLSWYNLSRSNYFHLFQANGNASVVIGDFYRFMHEMADVPILKLKPHTLNPDIFHQDRIFSSKVMGIKYGIQMDETNEGTLLLSSSVMPRAVLVKRALIIPDLEDQIAFMKKSVFNPLKIVLLQESIDGFEDDLTSVKNSEEGDKAIITRYEPNRIMIETFSGNDTYLVLSELFYPGWHAYVDGKETPILRADFLLRAIPLKGGKHQIVFRFQQQHFFTGAMITLMTVLFTAFLIALDFRKRKSF